MWSTVIGWRNPALQYGRLSHIWQMAPLLVAKMAQTYGPLMHWLIFEPNFSLHPHRPAVASLRCLKMLVSTCNMHVEESIDSRTSPLATLFDVEELSNSPWLFSFF